MTGNLMDVALQALRDTQEACEVSECPWCGRYGPNYSDNQRPPADCHHEFNLMPWQALWPHNVSFDKDGELLAVPVRLTARCEFCKSAIANVHTDACRQRVQPTSCRHAKRGASCVYHCGNAECLK